LFLGKPKLGERVPTFRHALGADQKNQQIAGADGLPNARVVGVAFGKLGAVEKELMALRAQRQCNFLRDRALLGGI
jgi:hypothetical protein